MNASVDVSLADFIYAIVAGAAFQNIQPPLLSYSNGLILVCFFVLVDDWVLYHTPARAIERNPRTFAACLALDLLVLVLWYGAAIKGRQGVETIAGFALLLVFFYLATAFWEIIFTPAAADFVALSANHSLGRSGTWDNAGSVRAFNSGLVKSLAILISGARICALVQTKGWRVG